MESSPCKKPRLDLSKCILVKSDSASSREIVNYMDMDNESVSHLIEKESNVNSTPNINSNSPGGLMVQKASTSNDTSVESVKQLFERFYKETDRKSEKISWKEFGPAQYHHWGILAKIKESSCTLRELAKNVSLENITNCKATFIAILAELEFEYTVVELPSLNPAKFPCIFAFDVKSMPRYSFIGCGATKDEAINEAAKKGLYFFKASCL